MLIKLLESCKFWAPNDGGGKSDTVDLDSKSVETYDLLNTEDDEAPIDIEPKKKIDKEEKEDKDEPTTEEDEPDTDEEEEETDELAELEQELETPDEEKLELVTPVRRREILSKYPKLFKDFPYLEKAYYRDQQFTEIFPTIDDAKYTAEKARVFDDYENRIANGSIEEILKTVKSENQEAFNKIADNYLLALWNADQSVYHHVVGNFSKLLIADMVQEGKKLQNDSLVQAAAILNQWVFGRNDWEAPKRLSKETNDPEKTKLDTERQQFLQHRFEIARDELSTKVSNALKATIEQNIDKSNSMTSYVKKSACNDAMELLEKMIGQDTGFQKLKDKLWLRASEEGFSKPAQDRIRSAIVTKAKVLLPAVIKRARNEALKGLGRKAVEDTEDVNDGSTRPNKDRKTTSSPRSGNYTEKAKKIPKGMGTLEYFNSD